MVAAIRRGVRRSAVRSALGIAGLLLVGCAGPGTPEFTTNQEVALHLTQSAESPVTARVPRGTLAEPLGWVGDQCECWLVTTPNGTGWIFNRYLDMHLADSPLNE